MAMNITSHLPQIQWEGLWVKDLQWTIGAFIAILASFVSNLGLNLQKLAHLENTYYKPLQREYEKPKWDRVSYITQPKWLLGMIFIVLGSFADFAALAFTAQSLVATLGSLTLVSNMVIAPVMLNETIDRSNVRNMFLICGGCTLSVAFGPHHDSLIFNLDTLFDIYSSTRFQYYAFIIILLVFGMYSCITSIEEKYAIYDNTNLRRYCYLPNSAVHRLHRFLYPALSGVIGAQSVLLGKCTAEAIKTTLTFEDQQISDRVELWIVVFLMLTSVFAQVYWLNSGLQIFDALYCVPIFQTFWILISIFGGLVCYDELKSFSFNQFFFFTIGCCITLFGVYRLSRATGFSTNPKTKSFEDWLDDSSNSSQPILPDKNGSAFIISKFSRQSFVGNIPNDVNKLPQRVLDCESLSKISSWKDVNSNNNSSNIYMSQPAKRQTSKPPGLVVNKNCAD